MELIKDYVCKITENNIHIEDSYKIKDKGEMEEVLFIIQHNHPECKVFTRSYESLMREWRVHNRLFKLGLFKSHTQHVDLNYPIKWYMLLIYWILGI